MIIAITVKLTLKQLNIQRETNYILKITGMDCNNCAKTIEQSVLKLNVVQDARISFATGKLHLNVNSKEDILTSHTND